MLRASKLVAKNTSMSVADIPVLLLFDFCVAFPSVCHAWMEEVLKNVSLPVGFLAIVNAL